MERKLDGLEWRDLNKPSAVHVNYQGRLDIPVLEESAKVLSARYPALRSRVRIETGGGSFVNEPTSALPFAVYRMDGTDYIRQVGQEWDVERALAQIIVVQGDFQGVVAMYTDHSIGDGNVKIELFRNLWEIYSRLVQGGDEPIDINRNFPKSPSQILESSGVPRIRPETTPVATQRPLVRRVMRQHYIGLSEKETRGLVRAARSRSMTVNSVLCGVILVAQRDAMHPNQAPVSMTCICPVDFRDHFQPRVGPTETTCFAGVHRSVVQVDPADDPVRVGIDVGRQLMSGISSGDPVRDLLERVAGVRRAPIEPGLHTATVTNLGRLEPFTTCPGLKLDNFNLLTYATDIPNIGYAIYTYDDHLNIQVFYSPETCRPSEVDRVTSQVLSSLKQISGDQTC